jgi:RimJ/RimL family protein N-acetyltransferase
MLETRQYEIDVTAGNYAEASLGDVLTGIGPFRATDAQALFGAVQESVNEICAWMVWCRPDYSLADSERFISSSAAQWEAGARYNFKIFDPRSGSLMGSIGLSAICLTHRFANVGYWVRTGMTRRGVASAALRLAARFAFEQAGLERLEIVMPAHNRASVRVAEKAGARFEGVLRGRLWLGGGIYDGLMYSLVKDDLPPVSCGPGAEQRNRHAR